MRVDTRDLAEANQCGLLHYIIGPFLNPRPGKSCTTLQHGTSLGLCGKCFGDYCHRLWEKQMPMSGGSINRAPMEVCCSSRLPKFCNSASASASAYAFHIHWYQSAERRWKSAVAADFHNFIILMHWQDHSISFKMYFKCLCIPFPSIRSSRLCSVDQPAKRWKSAAAADIHEPFISSIIILPSSCTSSSSSSLSFQRQLRSCQDYRFEQKLNSNGSRLEHSISIEEQ